MVRFLIEFSIKRILVILQFHIFLQADEKEEKHPKGI